MSTKKFRVLSLDGGGSKGMYTLGVLQQLELKVKSPLVEFFDYFYGCSTGAIIASALAVGKRVSEILALYQTEIPAVMNCFLPGTRSRMLRMALEEAFAGHGWGTVKKPLSIVTSSLDTKTVKIFKSHKEFLLGTKDSFEPGFGFPLVDALVASCSAFPFFRRASLVHENKAREFSLIDGGFSGNNPTLFALVDAQYAKKIELDQIRLLSVGTGRFSTKWSWCNFLAKGFISDLLEIGGNSTEGIAKYLLSDVWLRINEAHADGDMATNFLESNLTRLRKMHEFGERDFGKFEKEFERLFV